MGLLRIVSFGYLGKTAKAVQGLAEPQAQVKEEELPKVADKPARCCLTQDERNRLAGERNIGRAKFITDLGIYRAKALELLEYFGEDVDLNSTLLQIRDSNEFKQILRANAVSTFEEALLLARNQSDVLNLLSAAARANTALYITPSKRDNTGTYYRAPGDKDKEVHLDTASPYTLKEHIVIFRQELASIKKRVGII